MMKSFSLENKVILITGATGHLGTAISHQLAKSNAHIIINGRCLDKLQTLAETIKNHHGKVSLLAGDISNEDQQKNIVQQIKKEIGRLDGLVNNAYAGATGTIDTTSTDQIRDSLEMNLVAPLGLTQKLLPLLKNSEAASIVNVASIYGMVSPDERIYTDSQHKNPPFYGAGKAGLIQLTRYLACHLADQNIRVNAVSPGPFPPQSIKIDHPTFHEKLVSKVPMGRIGLAGEVGGAIQFLLSDAASYITGVNLPIDGGWCAGSH